MHYQRGISKFLPGAQDSYGEGRPLKFRGGRVRQFWANGSYWTPAPFVPWWNELNPYSGVGEYTLIDTDGPPEVAQIANPYNASNSLKGPTRPGDTWGIAEISRTNQITIR
jgi:hypothetical protein